MLVSQAAKVTDSITLATSVTIKELPDYLLSRGRYSATTQEIAGLTGAPPQHVRQGLARLRRQHKVFTPSRGLWVFVPPEYQAWGVLPADQFVDDMMRHLARDYYVALLSAAEIHGAAHQRPQVFQVIADGRVANRDIGRVRLRFFSSRNVDDTPTETENTPAGTIEVSTREATAVDLVDRPRASGGLSNVATILRELGPLDGAELAGLSSRHPRSHARRLGWMVEHFSEETDLEPLRRLAKVGEGVPVALSASGQRQGPIDRKWGLWLNDEVQPDV